MHNIILSLRQERSLYLYLVVNLPIAESILQRKNHVAIFALSYSYSDLKKNTTDVCVMTFHALVVFYVCMQLHNLDFIEVPFQSNSPAIFSPLLSST